MSQKIQTIAVYTSGGDAPGMNAALRAVVRTAAHHQLAVFGIEHGYEGMIEGHFKKLEVRDVGNIMQRGGTFLKTARSDRFRTPEGRSLAFEQLKSRGIQACVVLGGDGSFSGAELFSKEHGIPFIGVPCTIDNDLYGTDFSIGFDTAVNTAVAAVDKIRDTAESHNRLFFVEVMGRSAGFIALHTAIASGAGNVLLPEKETTLDELVKILEESVQRRKRFNLIIVAEGSSIGGADEVARPGEGARGRLRRAGDGHRALAARRPPSSQDRLLAGRLGSAAVEALLDGMKNVMVGIVNHQIKHTPLSIAVRNQKEPDLDLMRLAEMLAI